MSGTALSKRWIALQEKTVREEEKILLEAIDKAEGNVVVAASMLGFTYSWTNRRVLRMEARIGKRCNRIARGAHQKTPRTARRTPKLKVKG